MSIINLLVENHKIDERKIREEITNKLGKSVLSNWFSDFTIVEQNAFAVTLAFESRFVKEWVSLNYHSALQDILKSYLPNLKDVSYIVKESNSEDTVVINQIEESTKNNKIAKLRNDNAKPVKSGNELIQFSFSNFITDKENLLAFTAIKNLACADDYQFNADIIFIYGNVGVGKTHLLKAARQELKQHVKEEKILYSSSERFVYNYIKALKSGNLVSFKEELSNVDYLLIDDFQFIQAKGASQQELLALINCFTEENKKIIIAADRAPNNFTEIDQKIISRINGGLVLKIDAPRIMLKMRICSSKAASVQLELSSEIVSFIAGSVKTIREIDGIISKLKIYRDIFSVTISLELAKEIIGEVANNNKKNTILTVEEIQREVSSFFGISESDILSTKRHKVISRARHIAMYLAKIHTRDSLLVIAKKFNRLDHSTVVHAFNKIKKSIADYSEISEIEEKLKD